MKSIKLILILSLTLLTACSYFFPDKEKDYVYSKRIPPLDIPPDLQAEATLPELDPDLLPVTLHNTITRISDGNITYLRINSPFAHAWRVVGKGLSVNPVEITDKNRSSAIYYVLYDPDIPVLEENSSWGKKFFSFGTDANDGMPYQIYLSQTEQGTEIFVRDDFGDPINHGDGLKLLDLLYVTIEDNFTPDIIPDVQAEEPIVEIDPVVPVAVSTTNTQIEDETEVYSSDLQTEQPLTVQETVETDEVINTSTPVEGDTGVYASDLQTEESLTEQQTVVTDEVINTSTPVEGDTGVYASDLQTEEPLTEQQRVVTDEVINTSTPVEGDTEVHSSNLQAEEPITTLAPALPVAVSHSNTQIDNGTEARSADLQAEKPISESEPDAVDGTLNKNTILFIDEGDSVYLSVSSSFAHTWRVVGKALTASSIEITDKNRSNATYYVLYDPDAQIVEDGSFWDEVVFFFGDDPNQELSYQVYLTQTEQATLIYVKDDLGDNLHRGNGLKLLNLLYETIDEDFAN